MDNSVLNSRRTTKGQTNDCSGRQEDNSKTICGKPGYFHSMRTRSTSAVLAALVGDKALAFKSMSRFVYAFVDNVMIPSLFV